MKSVKMWAWWYNKAETFRYVYDSKKKVEMCFPYGSTVEEDKGNGKLLEIIVMPTEDFLRVMRC